MANINESQAASAESMAQTVAETPEKVRRANIPVQTVGKDLVTLQETRNAQGVRTSRVVKISFDNFPQADSLHKYTYVSGIGKHAGTGKNRVFKYDPCIFLDDMRLRVWVSAATILAPSLSDSAIKKAVRIQKLRAEDDRIEARVRKAQIALGLLPATAETPVTESKESVDAGQPIDVGKAKQKRPESVLVSIPALHDPERFPVRCPVPLAPNYDAVKGGGHVDLDGIRYSFYVDQFNPEGFEKVHKERNESEDVKLLKSMQESKSALAMVLETLAEKTVYQQRLASEEAARAERKVNPSKK